VINGFTKWAKWVNFFFMVLRRFVWVQSHGTAKRRKQRTGGAETQRSEEGEILAGKNEPFPPLTSASPRLLFDFSRFDEPQRWRKDPHETPQSLFYSKPVALSAAKWPTGYSGKIVFYCGF
jgi:hypothetical protein